MATDVSENRRLNFRALVERLGGPRVTAEQLAMNESQVSHLISDTVKKNIGVKLARKIEEAANMAVGALDMPFSHGSNIINVPVVDPEYVNGNQEFAFPNAEFIEGNEYVVWDNANPHRVQGNLAAAYCWDDSLAPMVNRGDLMIADGGVTRPKPGAIVVIATPRQKAKGSKFPETVVRILRQVTTDQWLLTSPNPNYADIPISQAELEQHLAGEIVEIRFYRPQTHTF